MAVLSIKRDYGVEPSMVRITTDSPIEEIVKTNWIFTQKESIEEVNNGEFDWKDGDIVVINSAISSETGVSSTFFGRIFPGFNSVDPIPPLYPNLQNIVARSGGGQANATQLNIGINVVTVAASVGDSVKLPDDVLGQTVFIHNVSDNDINVFPYPGDYINSSAVNLPFVILDGSRAIFVGTTTTGWATIEQ